MTLGEQLGLLILSNTFVCAIAGFIIGLTWDNFRDARKAIDKIKGRLKNKTNKK